MNFNDIPRDWGALALAESEPIRVHPPEGGWYVEAAGRPLPVSGGPHFPEYWLDRKTAAIRYRMDNDPILQDAALELAVATGLHPAAAEGLLASAVEHADMYDKGGDRPEAHNLPKEAGFLAHQCERADMTYLFLEDPDGLDAGSQVREAPMPLPPLSEKMQAVARRALVAVCRLEV
jgi:hypothetical protein